MRYVISRYKAYQKEMAYRIYITDSLFYLGQMKSLNVRYYDLVNPRPKETRTGDEIALDVIEKAGLRFG